MLEDAMVREAVLLLLEAEEEEVEAEAEEVAAMASALAASSAFPGLQVVLGGASLPAMGAEMRWSAVVRVGSPRAAPHLALMVSSGEVATRVLGAV